MIDPDHSTERKSQGLRELGELLRDKYDSNDYWMILPASAGALMKIVSIHSRFYDGCNEDDYRHVTALFEDGFIPLVFASKNRMSLTELAGEVLTGVPDGQKKSWMQSIEDSRQNIIPIGRDDDQGERLVKSIQSLMAPKGYRSDLN